MKYIIIALVFLLNNHFLISQNINVKSDSKSNSIRLDSLANTVGLEFVYGDKFPLINPYNSYGSTAVFDFLYKPDDDSISKSVLFLCRKRNKSYEKKIKENAIDLVHFYDYFLIFAIKKKGKKQFKIIKIFNKGVGLKGMFLYHSDLKMNLSMFNYVDNPKIKGSKEINLGILNNTPIIISSESAFQVLLYYKGKWLEYIERDI